MTKNPFDNDPIHKIAGFADSSALNLAKQFDNLPLTQLTRVMDQMPSVQLERVIQNTDIVRIHAMAAKAAESIDLYTNSKEWAAVSRAIDNAARYFQNPEFIRSIGLIESNLVRIASVVDQAIIPRANALQAIAANAANAIQPVHEHLMRLDWQSSLIERMEAVSTPWAMEDHLGVSVVGFARIARLRDASTAAASFDAPTNELFSEELGQPVEFDEDSEPEERDAAAMDAGMNPEVVAFPRPAYPTVLLSAGFELCVETISVVQSENADPSGIFDPQHATLLQQVEHHLRTLVVTELQKLVGEKWLLSRVPGPTKKRWEERKQKDHDVRGDSYPLIFYADFMDLSEVICMKNNWSEAFGHMFVSKQDFQISLQRLSPVRNAISHNRPLVRSDQLILFSEANRILTALGIKIT